jgi:hypothetical protein
MREMEKPLRLAPNDALAEMLSRDADREEPPAPLPRQAQPQTTTLHPVAIPPPDWRAEEAERKRREAVENPLVEEEEPGRGDPAKAKPR